MKFLLSIAGFDPTGGAGILRDIRTFNYFGFYGTAVITANTAQNTKGVKKLSFVDGELIEEQLQLIVEEFRIEGVKVGIPHVDYEVNRKVAEFLKELRVPVVFDPVISPTFGKRFIEKPETILPLIEVSTVITPNLGEFEILKPLLKEYTGFIVVKGIPKGDFVEDHLLKADNVISKVSHKKDNLTVRGTGCAFSSALLCSTVKGYSVEAAFREAAKFLEVFRKDSFKKGSMKQHFSRL
ncbi:hydroxymethylpyrimidine/phosphomethylpyrimidine kinase [Phorcysia thermohydrogeniphila]|uniref:hydroxymethylpyrimidine kinase n=1 Tax=Phorcysia thermohydrogeniphila TaxID=936138 RepID=A0A4R1G761_9BACT|nr:hydroxymethylpyrimidine/phosphomethylpyrimidine kinase [Phorcysia thermohydrogeniphila]TCK03348.1 hydroxymethylpyrimidine/phosphomethylpyrimidine kinase [Phorcysia thermohydrogeniphila]